MIQRKIQNQHSLKISESEQSQNNESSLIQNKNQKILKQQKKQNCAINRLRNRSVQQ